MTQEGARRTQKPAAALETARLLNLLEKSHRALEQDSESTDRTAMVSLRLARDEAITLLLRLNAQIAELSRTQLKVIEATRQLELELNSVSAHCNDPTSNPKDIS